MHPCPALGMSQRLCPTTHCLVASQHLIAFFNIPLPGPFTSAFLSPYLAVAIHQ